MASHLDPRAQNNPDAEYKAFKSGKPKRDNAEIARGYENLSHGINQSKNTKDARETW